MTRNTRRRLPDGWLPMHLAPRDGTIILVCESPNGEHWNVMPASYQRHLGNKLLEGFWGVGSTSRLPIHIQPPDGHADDDCRLPVDFRSLAITPVCWQPMPACEPVEKLRRRAGQIYAANARRRNTM